MDGPATAMYIGLNAARLSHALNVLFAVDQVSWVAHGCRCAEQGLEHIRCNNV
jgi:hypothetical protein